MRRFLAAAGLAAVLLAAGGCTNTDGSGASAGASGSAGVGASKGPSRAPVSVSPADRQVCTDTQKLISDSTGRFGQEVTKALQASSVAEGEQKALAAVRTLFADWAAGMRTQAGKATNPDLKSALTEYATGLEKVNAQIRTTADLAKLQQLNTPEIESANEKVANICG
jgi:hypothetical protein